ncbi:MAG: hypothetical protein RLZZ408_708 [Verrucomicrobiota bacterium]|jgi:hypothetical protein
MKPLQILLAILLIGVSATVGGVAGFRYAKSSAVTAMPSPRVEAVLPPRSDVKDAGREKKTINLAAAEKVDGETSAPSTLQEFRERIKKAKAELNERKVYMLQHDAVQSLDPSQILDALSEANSMKTSLERQQLRNMLLSRWVESDPKAALAYAQGIGNATEKSDAIGTVASSWGFKDFAAAKAWVESLPPGTLRNQSMDHILYGLARKDPATAMGIASSLPGDQGISSQRYALNEWANKNADAAIRYVSELPNGVTKERALRQMIYKIAENNPAKAIDLLDLIPPGNQQNHAIETIAANWAMNDKKAALDWANQQTDQEVRSRILDGAIRAMQTTDPKGALELAQSLPVGKSRDDKIIVSLFSMAQSDPQSAIGLASGMADANLRSKAQQSVVTRWMRGDPTAATQWVNSSSLPQDVKNRLLQKSSQPETGGMSENFIIHL